MKRLLIALALLAMALGGCGDDAGSADSTTTTSVDDATTTTIAASATTTAGSAAGDEWDLSGLEIFMRQPRLWRTVTAPPEGADATIYAPSDNNFVAERLSITAVPLDSTATDAEDAEAAARDLEGHFDEIRVQSTVPTQIGTDGRPAQQLQFTWQQPTEAGVGWRWVVRADTQTLYITFLADLSEPNLYLSVVQDLLEDARIGA